MFVTLVTVLVTVVQRHQQTASSVLTPISSGKLVLMSAQPLVTVDSMVILEQVYALFARSAASFAST